MPALVSSSVSLVRFIRKLRGGSQPILAQASDGQLYVVKFTNNPQGRNLSFNEAIGTELYAACGLSVPVWKPILVTDEFLKQNPECWIEMQHGELRPEAGLCFASHYLGQKEKRPLEILPGSSFKRIANATDFWMAWLLDICASHTDNRQAIYVERRAHLHAIFVDHGHMFSGPDGSSSQPHFRASAYLDSRIYEPISKNYRMHLARTVLNLNVDRLWRVAEVLPIDWKTESAFRSFAICLELLSRSNVVRSIIELIADSRNKAGPCGFSAFRERRIPPSGILHAGI